MRIFKVKIFFFHFFFRPKIIIYGCVLKKNEKKKENFMREKTNSFFFFVNSTTISAETTTTITKKMFGSSVGKNGCEGFGEGRIGGNCEEKREFKVLCTGLGIRRICHYCPECYERAKRGLTFWGIKVVDTD
jgi:hypothetical protein